MRRDVGFVSGSADGDPAECDQLEPTLGEVANFVRVLESLQDDGIMLEAEG